MKYPNVYVNELQKKERENHPDLDIFIRYETDKTCASIKYTNKDNESLMVEFGRDGFDERFYLKDANYEGAFNGTLLQAVCENEDRGGNFTVDVNSTEELMQLNNTSKNGREWYELCQSYIWNRKDLGIDSFSNRPREKEAKELGIDLENFKYQGFNLDECVQIAKEAKEKGVSFEDYYNERVALARREKMSAQKEEDNKKRKPVERD